MTPEMAQSWIKEKSNPKNRTISKKTVLKYRDEMNSGNWQLNGETICIDQNGVLVNGHHRLLALANAKRSVDLLVVFGVDHSSFETTDTGMKRNGAHALQINGAKNALKLSAVITATIMYRSALKRGGSYNSYIRPNNREIVYEYDCHISEYNEAVKHCISTRSICPISVSGHLAGYGFVDKRYYDEIPHFFRSLATGEMLSLKSPILTLRNALIRAKNDKRSGTYSKSTNWMKNAMIVAWNAHIEGRNLSLIRMEDPNRAIQMK